MLPEFVNTITVIIIINVALYYSCGLNNNYLSGRFEIILTSRRLKVVVMSLTMSSVTVAVKAKTGHSKILCRTPTFL